MLVERWFTWCYQIIIFNCQLQCCGGNKGAADWLEQNKTIPWSCCGTEHEHTSNSTSCTTESKDFHKDPCDQKLIDILKANGAILGGVGIAIAIIQVYNHKFKNIFFCYFKLTCSYCFFSCLELSSLATSQVPLEKTTSLFKIIFSSKILF